MSKMSNTNLKLTAVNAFVLHSRSGGKYNCPTQSSKMSRLDHAVIDPDLQDY